MSVSKLWYRGKIFGKDGKPQAVYSPDSKIPPPHRSIQENGRYFLSCPGRTGSKLQSGAKCKDKISLGNRMACRHTLFNPDFVHWHMIWDSSFNSFQSFTASSTSTEHWQCWGVRRLPPSSNEGCVGKNDKQSLDKDSGGKSDHCSLIDFDQWGNILIWNCEGYNFIRLLVHKWYLNHSGIAHEIYRPKPKHLRRSWASLALTWTTSMTLVWSLSCRVLLSVSESWIFPGTCAYTPNWDNSTTCRSCNATLATNCSQLGHL